MEIAQTVSSPFDITLIDTEENKGIEIAKTIVAHSYKQPFQSKVTSIIIQEANNLTIEAQNALLKTLEEPPEKTQLILTAPNRDSLLPTVVSRCQELRLADKSEIKKESSEDVSETKLSQLLDKLDRISLDKQLLFWQARLENEVTKENPNKELLTKLHRYNKTLLKLKKAEKYSVNKKLLTLIAAIEQPTRT